MSGLPLRDFMAAHCEEILHRARATLATRTVPPPTEAEIADGVPWCLDQLLEGLHPERPSGLNGGATTPMLKRRSPLQGLAVSQVVRDYGEVCQSIAEIARDAVTPLRPEDLRLLAGCLDAAIGNATSHDDRDRPGPGTCGDLHLDSRRFEFFVHELRNLLHNATLAFELLQSENPSIGGSTGTVLRRSLAGACDLTLRPLVDGQLEQGVSSRSRFLVSPVIDELTSAARLRARARHITLDVMPVEDGVELDTDRHVLSAVLMNLLQNAVTFTQPGTTVTVSVIASPDRVLFEIRDECGGLPDGDVSALFRPYAHRVADRAGFGLGLAFSQWATEAIHGRISARDLPGVGCVFTMDLPRCSAPALAIAHGDTGSPLHNTTAAKGSAIDQAPETGRSEFPPVDRT